LISAEGSESLGERELLDLLFQPGFSTAPRKTELAGRGVGLDVVRSNLAQLNGEIEVETAKGMGCRFTLKVPLTLIISQALFVRCGSSMFALPLSLPPKLLLLGAGPDAAPIVDFAARVNWKVTLVDHRPVYADPSHFPLAEHVILARPEELGNSVELKHFSAAVVMSHHLPSDLSYLRTLAGATIPYVGLLGPAPRREKLLNDLGEDGRQLRARLHAPVGLALGGRSPESVALAIVAEIHAFLHGADARPWDGGVKPMQYVMKSQHE